MIFLCFKNLGLRNVAIAQASPVARLASSQQFRQHTTNPNFSQKKNLSTHTTLHPIKSLEIQSHTQFLKHKRERNG
jgi:hypothetical protein